MSNAFGIIGFDWSTPLPSGERDALLEKAVRVVRKWKLEVPAVLFLESTGPLAGIAGQGLVAFSPFAAPLLAGGIESVQKLHMLLEDPQNRERLIGLLMETEINAARK